MRDPAHRGAGREQLRDGRSSRRLHPCPGEVGRHSRADPLPLDREEVVDHLRDVDVAAVQRAAAVQQVAGLGTAEGEASGSRPWSSSTPS